MRGRIAVTLGFWLVVASGAVRADPLRYDWGLEDGVEYESNPGRIERIEGVPSQAVPPGSTLARVVASGALTADLGERNGLALSGAFGGKWFTQSQARAENVLVVQAAATDTQRLWQRTAAALALSYYAVFQR